MQVTPQIRFRGIDPSPAVESNIRGCIERLARFHERGARFDTLGRAPRSMGKLAGLRGVEGWRHLPQATAAGKGSLDGRSVRSWSIQL